MKAITNNPLLGISGNAFTIRFPDHPRRSISAEVLLRRVPVDTLKNLIETLKDKPFASVTVNDAKGRIHIAGLPMNRKQDGSIRLSLMREFSSLEGGKYVKGGEYPSETYQVTLKGEDVKWILDHAGKNC
jgi:hypothetical protein